MELNTLKLVKQAVVSQEFCEALFAVFWQHNLKEKTHDDNYNQNNKRSRQFYTDLLKDPMLQEQLKAATAPESLSELAVELGKEKGHSFTKEEILAAMAIEAAMEGEYVEVGEFLDA